MSSLRPEKIINMLSAVLVLIAGFYVIFFMPISLSPAAKAIIGVLLVLYFMIRMRHFRKKYGNDTKSSDNAETINNKGLDKKMN